MRALFFALVLACGGAARDDSMQECRATAPADPCFPGGDCVVTKAGNVECACCVQPDGHFAAIGSYFPVAITPRACAENAAWWREVCPQNGAR